MNSDRMESKKDCIAMLLAGGQGSRLYTLTEHTAKPAVPFGGKYRIIDFTLSNLVNSGIDTVGVLTQYQPLVLNEYIGNGQTWDLDRIQGGLRILPPYQGKTGSDWYSGTANAVWQNANFMERYAPEDVLILSGDHVYKMDYGPLLAYHRRQNADCTIASVCVAPESASRYGILTAGPDGRIREFEEKPDKPKSCCASMGVYVFRKKILLEYLKQDDECPESSHDFGKDVIPRMLSMGERMFMYPFEGYWKDVGTVESYWEANMDLLGKPPRFDLHDTAWRIMSGGQPHVPQSVGKDGCLRQCIAAEGCEIDGYAERSVLFHNVKIGKGAVVRHSILMDDVTVEAGAKVEYSILDRGVTVGSCASVGKPRNDGARITLVGAGAVVRNGMRVGEGVRLNGNAVSVPGEEAV